MSNLSEEKIKIVDNFTYWYETNTEKGVTSMPDYICKGLLDLYNKEKEKNKGLKNKIDELENANLTTVYLSGFYDGENKYKDKIKEKIKELRKKTANVVADEINEIIIHVLQDLLEEE